MSRSSSVPRQKILNNDLNDELPRLTKNSWLTNVSNDSNYKYIRGKNNSNNRYILKDKDITNAMNNIDNNYYRKLKGSNPIINKQLSNIENNYYEMKYYLNDKINRLEKNQRKVNDFLKYSLEQDRLQNDINQYKINKNFQDYKNKNFSEKEYLLDMLNQVPQMIEDKLGKIYLNELEESRNQKYFLNNIKEKMALELENQRRYDYLKYRQKLNEIMELKDNEEKEKFLLLNQIKQQKMKNRIQAIKYRNYLYRYQQAYQASRIPQYPQIPYYPFIPPDYQKQDSFGININEIIKMYFLRELMGKMKSDDNPNYMNFSNYPNPNYLPNINRYHYSRNSLDSRYGYGKRRKRKTYSTSSSYYSRYSTFDKRTKKNNNDNKNKEKKKEDKKSKNKAKSKKSKNDNNKSESQNSSGNGSQNESKSEDNNETNNNENEDENNEEDNNGEEGEDDNNGEEGEDDNNGEEGEDDNNGEEGDQDNNGEEGDQDNNGEEGEDDNNGEEGEDDNNGEEGGEG